MTKNNEKINDFVKTVLDAACALSEDKCGKNNSLIAHKLREGVKAVIDLQAWSTGIVTALLEAQEISEEVSDFLDDVFGDYEIYKVDGDRRREIIEANTRFRCGDMLKE